MHENRKITEERIQRFIRDHVERKTYREFADVSLAVYQVPGEPIPPREAIAATYEPIAVGARWGRPWGTMWLHVTGTVPEHWASTDDTDCELLVNLAFTNMPGFQAEALVFRPDGTTVKAINPYNHYLPVRPGEKLDYYLECAANPSVAGNWDFAPTPLGDPDTIPDEEIYEITELRLAHRDKRIWELHQDMLALKTLMDALPEHSSRRHEILRALEDACDIADPDDMSGTVQAARDALRPALSRPAASSALTVVATGHAHIDSAWLWPVRETIRKCARTFSNVCALMDADPEFTFSCSSAQQYAWIKQHYPALFERIKEKVAAGQFIPVGGMWVESDTNMPGSEAMARQFIAGKRFFLENFGVETTETWLPDSFGYSGALPQITALAGHEFFLTQKVSWNQYNTFPHHTFRWEGIDGTEMFTHFPPADTYNGMLSGTELAFFEKNFKDKGRSSIGIDLFGWGDGGGGPTREQIAAGRRAQDLDGSPKVEFGTPKEFFTRARDEYKEIQTWNGELYLELHRGTYSAQLSTKQGNRRSEHLLHEAEFLSSLASLSAPEAFEYPYDELEAMWHDVLLMQFHDILPGSSIAWVHKDAEHNYESVRTRSERIIETALAALSSAGVGLPGSIVNTAPVARGDIAPYAVGAASAATDPTANLRVTESGEGERRTWTLSNGLVTAVIDAAGNISSLVDADTGREAIAPGAAGALLQLHRDTPNAWDAWDIDEFYRRVVRDLTTPVSIEATQDEDAVRVAVTYRTATAEGEATRGVTGGESTIVQTYVLRRGASSLDIRHDIDWKEKKKALKLAFPLDLRAADMTSEIQFGHIKRPVPVNTSWDYARFETCAHRWVHLGEPDYGVAIANDSTYGHDVLRHTRPEDGGSTTIPRLTLVRSPEYPDPRADNKRYTLTVSIRPGAEIRDAVSEGYQVNLPVRVLPEPADGTQQQVPAAPAHPLVSVSHPAVIVETIKLAEDRSGDLVLRLYESEGSRAQALVSVADSLTDPKVVDLLERDFPETAPAHRTRLEETENGIALSFRPFEIKTLRLRRR
ncbi:alpha-mannosidase [Devriesea agamarum]|uniref:alpha-mannosidase n=1 Tax=Devriesea agamarum TaxID=472569 RepID=UPI00071E2E90|nr:glycoside hydrolase family 38 C-terminal domain-containing protein [Devriesea agamarum]